MCFRINNYFIRNYLPFARNTGFRRWVFADSNSRPTILLGVRRPIVLFGGEFFLQAIDDGFVGGFHMSVSLRVLGGQVSQGNSFGFAKVLNFFDMNWDPLSVIISCGVPCRQIMFFQMKFLTSTSFIEMNASASTHFEK